MGLAVCIGGPWTTNGAVAPGCQSGRVSNVGQDLFIRYRGPFDALKLEFRIAHVAS
jgi:hypothetical protein